VSESARKGESEKRRRRRVSGTDLARTLRDGARAGGWRHVHFRPARNAAGEWRTPFSGDRGFPDVVLARSGEVYLFELKAKGDRLREGQADWLAALGAPQGFGIVGAGIVTPDEVEAVAEYLSEPALDEWRGWTERRKALVELLSNRWLEAVGW
jgi:hypothetical protein